MKKICLILMICIVGVNFIFVGYAFAKKPVKTTQQLRVMQTKEFDAVCFSTFKAALSALQDNNFQVKDADQKAGFIYSQTGGKRSFMMGTVKNVDSSMTFEDLPDSRCQVRANLFEVVKKNSAGFLSVMVAATGAALGGSLPNNGVENGYESGKLIQKPEVYQQLYQSIQKNLFIKQVISQ